MTELLELLEKSREISYRHFGKNITFYLPGMFTYFGEKGAYPSVSITGKNCDLQCSHCKGVLLDSMIPAQTPDQLIEACQKISLEGNRGVLLTGGCSLQGTLPWKKFIPAIAYIKKNFDLLVSVHTGMLDLETALGLANAGVNQALIDIIGDDETYQSVYHLENGTKLLKQTLNALQESKISLVPHIVVGLNFGKISGEYRALEILQGIPIDALVFVSLMPLPGTPMNKSKPPSAEDIAKLIARARFLYPGILQSLGCARERGNHQIDLLALESGINRIAIPSEETIEKAKKLGLEIKWEKTCCSVGKKRSNQYGKSE